MSFKGNGFCFETGRRTYIMGILNITPDSFYDGGMYNSVEAAVLHAVRIEKDGADIIDVGANSTRPGAVILPAGRELEILRDILPSVVEAVNVPVSVDTFYPETAAFALECGAKIINDVSGRINPEIVRLVKNYRAGYIVMHNPLFSSEKTADYKNGVTADVEAFFCESEKSLVNFGLKSEQLLFDVGIGFSKSQHDDIELIRNLGFFKHNGRPLLVALSNKRMTSVMPDMIKTDRLYSTVAADSVAIVNGVDFIRVHNFREAKIAAEAVDRIVR